MADARRGAIRALIAGTLLVSAFVFFFLFPGHEPKPRGIEIAVAGPKPEADRLAADIERRADGFEVETLADGAAAGRAIRDREIYGAVVLAPERELLVAEAASPQVARIITVAFTRAPGGRLPARDLVPLDEDDSAGTSINLVGLPLAIASILGTLIVLSLAAPLPAAARAALLVAFAVLAGLATMLLANVAIGALPGPYARLAGIAALAVAAIALTAAGLVGLLGQPAVGLSFGLFLVLGNPASGAASAPALLPEPWQTGGQFLPNGAAATALRNIAYFDGVALAKPLLVLGAWIALGAALVLVAARRRRDTAEDDTAPASA